jgi:hypothetical protein
MINRHVGSSRATLFIAITYSSVILTCLIRTWKSTIVVRKVDSSGSRAYILYQILFVS